MNILQITPYFYPAWSYGGIPRVVYELSKALVRSGNKVVTLTTDVLSKKARYYKKEDVIEGVETHYFSNLSNTLAYHYQMYLPLGMRKWVANGLKDIHIAHFHGHRHFLNTITLEALMKKKVPYVLSAHGTVLKIERRIALKSIFDLLWGNKIIKNAGHFIAVSEKEAEQYESIGIPSQKISVVYNGIDTETFESLPEKGLFRERYNLQDRRIVLYLGKITPRKGLDILVQAIAEIPDNNIVLVVAGNDMGFKARVDGLIRKRHIEKRIFFSGLLVDRDKLSAYVDSDVLVYPSTLEIFGLVPFESIMCGTPVIVTDDCGCGEIIGRIGAGDIVRYGDVEGLKDKILDVLSNREEAQKRVEKGKKFIRQHLMWETISDDIQKVYESL